MESPNKDLTDEEYTKLIKKYVRENTSPTDGDCHEVHSNHLFQFAENKNWSG